MPVARALRVDDGESLSRSYLGAVRVYLKLTVARRLIMLEHTCPGWFCISRFSTVRWRYCHNIHCAARAVIKLNMLLYVINNQAMTVSLRMLTTSTC
jgi:hypothetical protein